MERLAGAVLIQMIEDWERGKDEVGIQAFLKSEWFETLVEAAGLERESAQNIRVQLVTGTYTRVSLRAAYR